MGPLQKTGAYWLAGFALFAVAFSGVEVEAAPPAEGRPLFYWGARAATIVVARAERHETDGAVEEIQAAVDKGSFVLRFTFDRDVADALTLPDGRPVSGRLRSVLHVDADNSRRTGLDSPGDPRRGADYRIEIGVIALGEDPDEKLEARALVTVVAAALLPDGRRRAVWHADSDDPVAVSIRGRAVEFRIPPSDVSVFPGARLIFSDERDRYSEGQLAP